MLPDNVTNLINGLVRAYDSQHPAQQEFRLLHTRFAESLVRRGFGWPTGAFPGIGGGIVQFLVGKASFIWKKSNEVVTSTQVESYPGMAEDLKNEVAKHLAPSLAEADAYLENLRQGTKVPAGAVEKIKETLQTALLTIHAEIDIFCAKYQTDERTRTQMNLAGKQNIHIEKSHGVFLGNVHNSQVTLYDYSSVNQLLIDQKIPKQDRRELEDIMDDLKEAAPEKKPSLLKRGEELIVKHKEALGAAAEIIRKAIGL